MSSLPSFIVIGPGRAASTWMQHILMSHPDVGMANGIKETLFFNCNWDRGIEWYEDFFQHASDLEVRGEISNTYLYSPIVPKRIRSVVPDVRLISVLRNPIDRIISIYHYRRRTGAVRGSFDESLGLFPDMITTNLYHMQLSWYLASFPREQLSLFLFDDLKVDSDKFTKEVYRSIGVADDFVPGAPSSRVNAGAAARSQVFGRMASDMARMARNMGYHRLLEKAKHNLLVRKLLYRDLKPSEFVELEAEYRSMLVDVFGEDIQKLEDLLQRDLSVWLR